MKRLNAIFILLAAIILLAVVSLPARGELSTAKAQAHLKRGALVVDVQVS